MALSSVLTSLPSPGLVYEARVAAIGPGGASRSAASNTFSFVSPCSFSITPTSQTIAPGGGAGSVTVAACRCAWTASRRRWIPSRRARFRQRRRDYDVSVSADVTASSRSGMRAGRRVTVESPRVDRRVSDHRESSAGGGTGPSRDSTAVAPWTATSERHMVAVQAANARFTIAFSATATASARTATPTVAGRSATLSQRRACSALEPLVPSS